MSSNKYPVSLNVPSTFDCIEMVYVNDATTELERATSMPCAFNRQKRQIDNPDAVASAIRDLYATNEIPLNTPAILTLPSVMTKEFEMSEDSHLSKEELRYMLASEAERFYIFKDKEPEISWIKADPTRLVYSAYPKAEVEKYVQVFQDLKIPLHSIDLSYFSVLRGLVATGAVTDEVSEQKPWALMILTDSTFFAAALQGMNILRTADTPFSPGGDDDYFEIQQDFENLINDEPMSKLVIVNNALNLNLDAMVSNVRFTGEKIPIDQSAQNLKSLGNAGGSYPCSLEALGGAFVREFGDLPHMNFKPKIAGEVGDVDNLKEQLFRVMLGVDIAMLLVVLAIWGCFGLLLKIKDDERISLSKRAAQSGSNIDAEQYKNLQLKLFIKKSLDQNVMVNDLLVKLGTLVDNDAWLDKVFMKIASDAQEVTIDGKSMTPERVNRIANELKRSTGRRDLDIDKVDAATSNDGQSHYVWTILTRNGDAAGGDGSGLAPTRPGGGPPVGGRR